MADSYIIARNLAGGRMPWCQSQLAAAIDEYALEITLLTGQGALMPSNYAFSLLCEEEILSCTGKLGDVLTVIRGINNTDPVPHAAGKIVRLIVQAIRSARSGGQKQISSFTYDPIVNKLKVIYRSD